VRYLGLNKPGLLAGIGVISAALTLLGACSMLLPRGEEETGSRWSSFAEAKQAYDQVVPFIATKKELDQLGFTPEEQPNVKILSHLDVLDRLVPGGTYDQDDLPRGVRACVAAGTECTAFEFTQKSIHSRRHGNFFSDFLNFRRKTETTGWAFNALFVLTGDHVVYKVWSGTPDIHTRKETTNPLGPLQGIGPSLSTEAVKP